MSLLLIALVASCTAEGNSSVLTTEPAADSPTVVAEEEQTATPAAAATSEPPLADTVVPSPTAEPTAAEPLPAATSEATVTLGPGSLRGPDIAYDGVSFTLPPELGDVIYYLVGGFIPDGISFNFDPAGECWRNPCIDIVPVEAMANTMRGGAIEQLAEGIASGELTEMPPSGAALLMQAHFAPLEFQNGSGYRAVVARGQDGYPVNNEALRYEFQGLTADGKFFVEFVYYIDAPNLISTYDPAENTNEKAFLVPELPDDFPERAQAINEYNAEAERLLQELSTDEFTPDLALLDVLVRSLLIQIEE
jgi:hypothetical protein